MNILSSLDEQYDRLISLLEQLVIELQKSYRIKMVSWIKKLDLPINNQSWKQNRNLHVKVMIKMIKANRLFHPFDKNPPEGALARIRVEDLPYPIRDSFLKREKSQSKKSLTKKENEKPNCKSFNQTQSTKKPTNKDEILSHRSSYNKYLESISETDFKEKQEKQKDRATKLMFSQTCTKANYTKCSKISQELQDNKVFLILRKTLKFLNKNHQILSDQFEYHSLLENITSIGDQNNINLRSISSVQEDAMSPTRMVFRKYDAGMRKNETERSQESARFREYSKDS